jgi:hypothetical protein
MTAKLNSIDLNWRDKLDFAKSGRTHPNPELAELEREWYGKLYASGFEDIEREPWRLKSCSYMKRHWLQTADTYVRGKMNGASEVRNLCDQAVQWVRFPSRSSRILASLVVSGWGIKDAQDAMVARGMAPTKLNLKDLREAQRQREQAEQAEDDTFEDDSYAWAGAVGARDGRIRRAPDGE